MQISPLIENWHLKYLKKRNVIPKSIFSSSSVNESSLGVFSEAEDLG
jgi:hypothetical protein